VGGNTRLVIQVTSCNNRSLSSSVYTTVVVPPFALPFPFDDPLVAPSTYSGVHDDGIITLGEVIGEAALTAREVVGFFPDPAAAEARSDGRSWLREELDGASEGCKERRVGGMMSSTEDRSTLTRSRRGVVCDYRSAVCLLTPGAR
jgi:hypothetical protein